MDPRTYVPATQKYACKQALGYLPREGARASATAPRKLPCISVRMEEEAREAANKGKNPVHGQHKLVDALLIRHPSFFPPGSEEIKEDLRGDRESNMEDSLTIVFSLIC